MAAPSDLHLTAEELFLQVTLGTVLLKAVAAGEVFLVKSVPSEGPE